MFYFAEINRSTECAYMRGYDLKDVCLLFWLQARAPERERLRV